MQKQASFRSRQVHDLFVELLVSVRRLKLAHREIVLQRKTRSLSEHAGHRASRAAFNLAEATDWLSSWGIPPSVTAAPAGRGSIRARPRLIQARITVDSPLPAANRYTFSVIASAAADANLSRLATGMSVMRP
jgi:hypothetical protein